MVSVRTALGMAFIVTGMTVRRWLAFLLAMLSAAATVVGTAVLWAVVQVATFIDGLTGARR